MALSGEKDPTLSTSSSRSTRERSEPQVALGSAGRKLVYFSAERTLLSWIRTALTLMAFGFVVDRFDVFLRTAGVGAMTRSGGVQDMTHQWAGTPIVYAGAVMAGVAAVRYLRFAWRYRKEGSTEPGFGILVAAGFALVVSALGFLLASLLRSFGS